MKIKFVKKSSVSLKEKLRNMKLPLILDFFRWVIIDIVRKKKNPPPLHFYGIHCISGMYGCGKTTVLSYIGQSYREKYGDKVYICSNYGFGLQDFPYESMATLSAHYDKPILFLWDEVQNDFPATDKVFPADVRKALTLNRKGNGKKIYWCSQDQELVHKTIRRLTIRTGNVRTIAHRLTRVRWYFQEDYLQLLNETDVKKKMKIRPLKTEKFIQTDDLRNLYNSFGIDNGEKIT